MHQQAEQNLGKQRYEVRLVENLKAKVLVQWCTGKRIQKCYNIFRIVRLKLVKKSAEVSRPPLTGLLISRRHNSVI